MSSENGIYCPYLQSDIPKKQVMGSFIKGLLKILACAAVTAVSLCAAAQDGSYEIIDTRIDSDFQPRADVEFEFPLVEDLSFIVNNEIRFMDNCTKVDRNYLLGALSYKTCDYFSVDAGYIFQSMLKQGNVEYDRHWEYRHRVYLDLKASIESGNWKFSLTERPLVNIRPWVTDETQYLKDEWIIRSKIKADYEIPKTDLTPYAFFELSNTLNTVEYGGGPFIDRLRFCLGFSWEVSDFNSIELYYYFDIRNTRDVSFTHGSDGSLYNIFLNREQQYVHVLGLSFNFGWD